MNFLFTYNNTVRVCPKNINNVSLELKIDKIFKIKNFTEVIRYVE